MILAKDIRKKMNEADPRFDDFITMSLENKFLSQGSRIKVSTSEVRDFFMPDLPTDHKFIQEMESRGFIVRYECDDRPCGSCWFEIAIPEEC